MRSAIIGVVLSVLVVALPASAEPTFPGAIQEAANIPCTPTCLLCHLTVPGEKDNWRQPFAGTALGNGLKPGQPETMPAMVENLRTNKIDTDHDGKLDVDELAAGSDPNKPDPSAAICGPTYGCGAHVAAVTPPPPTALWWFAVPVVLALLISARRHSRRGQA